MRKEYPPNVKKGGELCMDIFLRGVLERLVASFIVNKLFGKCKKPLEATTKSGWEFDLKITFRKNE